MTQTQIGKNLWALLCQWLFVGGGGQGWQHSFAFPHAHTRRATLLYVLLHFHTHVTIRSCTFSRTSTQMSCYAPVRSLALPHRRHATLMYVLSHFRTDVMLLCVPVHFHTHTSRYSPFSCTSTHTLLHRRFTRAEDSNWRTVWSMTKWRKETRCDSARLICQNVWENAKFLKTRLIFRGLQMMKLSFRWGKNTEILKRTGITHVLDDSYIRKHCKYLVNTMVCTKNMKLQNPLTATFHFRPGGMFFLPFFFILE